jgi:hypothetical protein
VSLTAVRNVVIILALAAGVDLLPGGGNASQAILEALVVIMLGSIAYLAMRLYRERRTELYSLGDRNRLVLYASFGLITITVVATDRLWNTGIGTIAWFALIGAAVYGVYWVYRSQKLY